MHSNSRRCRFAFLLLLNIFPKIIKTEGNFKIIGGSEAKPHIYPFLVGIRMRQPAEKSGWCGGALLSEEYILTAAHCLKGVQQATLYIGLHNIGDKTDQGIILDVFSRNFKVHHQWSSRYAINDIAMILLPKKIAFSATIQPIQLSDSANTYEHPDTTLTAAGWGRTSDNNTIPRPSSVHKINLKVLADEYCQKMYIYYNASLNICLDGNSEKSTCRGDSGGPIFFTNPYTGENTIVGITSYGRKCSSITVLTRVSSYLDWIDIRL